jgi:K+-transporting ATPase A subunit
MLRDAILWVHVLCGALLTAVSLSFVFAASAIADDERAAFAKRVVPKINRLNLIAIILLPLTGLGNLFFVDRAHHFRLPAAFTELVSVKVVLLCGIAVALKMAWGAATDRSRDTRRLLWLYGAMAAMGAVALMLGLWLAGSA